MKEVRMGAIAPPLTASNTQILGSQAEGAVARGAFEALIAILAIVETAFGSADIGFAIAETVFSKEFSIFGSSMAQSAEAKAVFAGSGIENHLANAVSAKEFSMLETLIAALASSRMGWRSHD